MYSYTLMWVWYTLEIFFVKIKLHSKNIPVIITGDLKPTFHWSCIRIKRKHIKMIPSGLSLLDQLNNSVLVNVVI